MPLDRIPRVWEQGAVRINIGKIYPAPFLSGKKEGKVQEWNFVCGNDWKIVAREIIKRGALPAQIHDTDVQARRYYVSLVFSISSCTYNGRNSCTHTAASLLALLAAPRFDQSSRYVGYMHFSSHRERSLAPPPYVRTHERRNTSWSRASLKTWWERIDVGFDQTLNKESSLSIFLLALLKREPQGEKSANRWAPCLMRSWRLRATGTSPLYHTHTRQQTCTTQIVVLLCRVRQWKAAGLVGSVAFLLFFPHLDSILRRPMWPTVQGSIHPSSVSSLIQQVFPLFYFIFLKKYFVLNSFFVSFFLGAVGAYASQLFVVLTQQKPIDSWALSIVKGFSQWTGAVLCLFFYFFWLSLFGWKREEQGVEINRFACSSIGARLPPVHLCGPSLVEEDSTYTQ